MAKIKKAVIPVAGFGTRFLPATKASPKEMLPIIDKPVIQYIVEQAVASGIEDIILVTGASKRAVEDHFDYNYELQEWLKKQGKTESYQQIKKIANLANFIYLRQKGPYGNGTPVLNAEKIIGNQPFAVLWGDEIVLNPQKPSLKQSIEVFEKYNDPVLTTIEVSQQDTCKYGIIDGIKIEDNVYQVKKLVEKPDANKAPSNIAVVGGYVLPPEIFQALKETKIGKGGELWLTDAIIKLAQTRPLYACAVKGTYYDAGSKFGWLKANIDLALEHKDTKDELKQYLKNIKL